MDEYVYYLNRHGHTSVYKDDVDSLNQRLDQEDIKYTHKEVEENMYFYEREDD